MYYGSVLRMTEKEKTEKLVNCTSVRLHWYVSDMQVLDSIA